MNVLPRAVASASRADTHTAFFRGARLLSKERRWREWLEFGGLRLAVSGKRACFRPSAYIPPDLAPSKNRLKILENILV